MRGILFFILVKLENYFWSLKRELRAILYLYNLIDNNEELIWKMLVLQMLLALELSLLIKNSKLPLQPDLLHISWRFLYRLLRLRLCVLRRC